MPDSWLSDQPNYREMRRMVFADYDLENKGSANIDSFEHTVHTYRFAHTAFEKITFILLFMITKLCRLNSFSEIVHSYIMGCFGAICRRIRNVRKVFNVLVLLLIVLPVLATAIVTRIFIACILRPFFEIFLLIDEIISASYK